MAMERFRLLFLAILPALAGCGGGSGGAAGTFSVDTGTFGSNGIAQATPDVSVADLAGETLAVTVARFLTNYETDATRLIASDETLVVGTADGFGFSEDFTLSLGGEELVFNGEIATDSSGREWTALRVTFGQASATTGLYSYSYGAGSDPIDSEGVFVAGFETAPAEIADRGGSAEFAGEWFGYGVLLDGAGNLVASELDGGGSVALTVNFGGSTVSGNVTGSYTTFGDIDAAFEDATVARGGFVSEPRSSCGGNCETDTTMAGRFYGSGAREVSGIIAWDETRAAAGSSGSLRLLSAAGFTAKE